MVKSYIKRFAVLILAATLSFNFMSASDDEMEKKDIIIKPVVAESPSKPKSPSRLRISAYVENDDVVVASTVSTMAQIEIYDSATGKCLFDRIVALAPDYRCTITDRGSLMTIYITVNGRTYEGSFVL